MPANPKHLTKSTWQQFAKISSGLLGGYIISSLFHMSLALWLPYSKEVLITAIYTHYIVWCGLLIVPFLFKNGWKAWALYAAVIVLVYVIYYFGNQYNSFV